MNIRFSRLATGLLVVAAVALIANISWAIYTGLEPSKDEWGLKYDVAVTEADAASLNIVFTLADEGRLKPIYKIDLIAFSKQTDSQGGRSYDLTMPVEFKSTPDGKRMAQMKMRKEFADRAHFRILTLTVNGQRQKYAAFYNIPIQKYLKSVPSGTPPLATPPAAKVKR